MKERRAKPLMIQGASSNAGKSFITAGLCRILAQDGFRVAPFKSQNMALNSGVTPDGKEMGRAQIMQAEAAGIKPSVLMNPILLKPTGDTGSQVIINGEARGVMSAREYFGFRKTLIPLIERAYDELAQEYDVIIAEGAGSPAEINLQQDDIVNMGLAELIHAPVLIAGDIDRGGVFASLYGTAALITPEQKRRVKGFIINRFRGDVSLLANAPAVLEQKSGIPVLGVIPYLPIALDDEDSLSERRAAGSGQRRGAYRIAVIALPHISNFTDLHPLERLSDTDIAYCTRPEQLAGAHLIVIPGTKNTIGDLRWLKSSGLAHELCRQVAEHGTPCIGICGGFQMLGTLVRDSAGAEQRGADCEEGLSLLPVQTEFQARKRTAQARGALPVLHGCFAPLSGLPYDGYEIHMGITTESGHAEPLLHKQGTRSTQNVLGTYVHGLFDSAHIVQALHRVITGNTQAAQQLPDIASYRAFKEQQYDTLAAALRASLDMERVYRIIEEGE